MKTIILTGATGTIGRHLTHRLIEAGHTVVALGRHQPPHPAARWVQHDLAGDGTLPPALPEQADALVFLAQSSHFREFPERAQDVFAVNVASVARLLDWARQRQVRNFTMASSGGVYGFGAHGFKEDDVVGGAGELGFYLASKCCAELLAESYASMMNVAILRPFFVYGPGQRETMLIPRLLASVRAGTPIRLQGNDGILINPTYVADAVEAIAASLELTASHKINVAGPDVLSMRQIGDIMGEAVGRAPVFDVHDEAPRHLVGDISRMGQLLVRPQVGFREGIRRYIASLAK